MPLEAQINWGKAISGIWKTGQALTVSEKDMAKIAAEEVAYMDKSNKICSDRNSYSKRLNKLMKDIDSVEGLQLNFKVYKTKEANAFACPDGSVRVFSALMDELTDDELLGVIGHEIGHVALRHSKKAWRSALLRSAASDAMGAMSSKWAGLSDSVLGDLTSAALTAKHSRYHETEADDYGYDFLKKSGKNPWAMGLAFIKLKELSKKSSSSRFDKWLQTFSSHPDFDERIARMKNKAKKDGYPVGK
jgi:putative metalloprotease